MMYKVIKYFTDLHDNSYPYDVGDVFPRPGVAVSEGRLAELAGSNNKQHTPLIQRVEEVAEPVAEEEAPKKKAPAKRTKKTTEE